MVILSSSRRRWDAIQGLILRLTKSNNIRMGGRPGGGVLGRRGRRGVGGRQGRVQRTCGREKKKPKVKRGLSIDKGHTKAIQR